MAFGKSSVFCQAIDVSLYQQQYQLTIKKAADRIKIDGVGDEASWQQADSAKDFWLKFPRDDEKARHQTIVKVTYDNNFLYMLGIVYDSLPLIGQSLKRDSRIRESDGLGLMLDPMNKKTNGAYFTVTAFNVQADDLLSAGFSNELSFSWDNKWYSATKIHLDHYVIEMAIPFKTLRYNKDNQVWGINFVRSEKKVNEFHTWTRVPVNFSSVDLGYFGALIWDAPPPKPGNNIALIPYVTGSIIQNKEDSIGWKTSADAGFDAKIAVTSSLNLDLTFNPDFSQVEVDRQVTNLSRFDIFFPERRNFFIENSDLFSEYGIPPIRPFYSRRIGLDPDGNTIPIAGGVRLTGNVASRTRIGLLSIQTKAINNYASQNYSAVTVMQQILRRSSVKAYFLNRQGFYNNTHKLEDPIEEYGRNAGIEFNYKNAEGDWQGWMGYHHASKPGIRKENTYMATGGGYFGRNFNFIIDIGNTGKNYYADMGFVNRIENYDDLNDTTIRLGFKQIFNQNSYSIYPKKGKGKINQHKFQLENFIVWNPNNTFNEGTTELSYEIEFKNTSSFGVGFSNQKTDLLFHTSFADGAPLPPGSYSFKKAGIGYESDSRKNFSMGVELYTGKYFNADFQQVVGSIIFRKQPWFTLELNGEFNKLVFPGPYGKDNLFLLASRIEVNFNTRLFWTTFIQYYTQGNNINFNSRLQWRYKPVSDFYLVYTDNYFSDPFFKNKNRALVFKLNYWLNL